MNLLLKLGRGREALEVSRKHLAKTDGRPTSCPNLNELCQRLGAYEMLAEVARELNDPVYYLAGLLAARAGEKEEESPAKAQSRKESRKKV